MSKGKFIVFEGIDGSGTSTQAELLKGYFQSKGIKSHLTSEPSSGPIGNLIRQAMKGRLNFSTQKTGSRDRFDDQMAYLFAADRHDHLFNEIDGVFKLTGSGMMVISTRYYFSSLAYNATNPENLTFVSMLNSQFPKPDLVIYLRNSVDESISRLSNRAFSEQYENKDKLEAVSRNYHEVFKNYDGELLILPANLDRAFIHDQIIEKIQDICK